MHTARLGVLSGATLALAVTFVACSDDDEPTLVQNVAGESGAGDAGMAGEPAGGGRGATGGSSSPRGGSSGKGGRGGSAGSTSSDGGSLNRGGGAGHSSGGGGVAGETSISNELTICDRLTNPNSLSYDVTLAYERDVIFDCDINWVTSLYYDPSRSLDDSYRFLNALNSWNLDLWGCRTNGPTTFALIWTPPRATPHSLTSADAQALIDDYVDTTANLLGMSPGEIDDMRAVLGRLSEPLIDDSVTSGLSNPRCSGGAGGGGGSAGTGGLEPGGAGGEAGAAGGPI